MSSRSRQADDTVVHETVITRIDIPFLQLTWFFVKASLAAAVALVLTSFVWLFVAAGAIGVGVSVSVVVAEVQERLAVAPELREPTAAATPATPVETEADAERDAEPVVAEVVEVTRAEVVPLTPEEAHRQATLALQRQELERMRSGRHRYDQVPTP